MSRRMILVLVGLGIATLASAPPVASETDLGQFCFAVAGNSDAIRITATQPLGAAPIIAVHFRWRAPGYQILGSGSASTGLDLRFIDLGLVGTHNTSAFGGNRICALYAVLDPLGGSGPFTLTCTGLSFSGQAFVTTGTLIGVPCVGDGLTPTPQ